MGIQGWKGVREPLRGRKTLLEASIIVTVSSPPEATELDLGGITHEPSEPGQVC